MHDLVAHYSQIFQAALAEWPTQPVWLKTVREQQLQNFLAFVDSSFAKYEKCAKSQAPAGSCRCSFPDARKKRAASGDPCFRVTPSASATRNDSLNSEQNIVPTSDICIVFVNGYYCANLSKLTDAIQVTDYQTATVQHAQQLQRIMHTVNSNLEDYERHSQHNIGPSCKGCTSLNIALANSGVWLDVPADIVLTTPIELLFITTEHANDRLCTTHNIVNIGANSRIQLSERHINLTANASFSNTLTHVNLATNAHLQYYKQENANNNGCSVANTYILQHQHSVANTYYVSKNIKQSCDNIIVILAEENAHYTATGLYQPEAQQTIDYHLLIKHKAPKCTSNVLFKGIVNSEAVGTFSGRVVVEPLAIDSETHLKNHNLLLSPTARANTAPELKIYTDNVICTHGATIGQLDEQALFYLRTRGIDEATAKDMLVQAFVAEILPQIPNNLKIT